MATPKPSVNESPSITIKVWASANPEKEIMQKKQPSVIIFDEILKPSQNYNLASELKIEVLDRESLILEIFESRAQSTESQLQVKLAQLRYEMSRAKEK